MPPNMPTMPPYSSGTGTSPSTQSMVNPITFGMTVFSAVMTMLAAMHATKSPTLPLTK